jgi:hypothetical protein
MVISRHFSVLYIITQSVFFDLNQLRHFQQSTRVNSTLHNALPTKHTTTMSAPRPRRGHAAVAAILSDMDRYLPSDTINRADYRRCRMVYGLMNTTYRRTDASTSPEKEYMELKILTSDLRRHLNALNASKGIPEKMSLYLDELTAAIDDGLAKGVSTEFLIAGIEDLLKEDLDARTEDRGERVRMMPDTQYKKVKAELKEAKARIKELNEENNALVLRLKIAEGAKARLGTW